MTVDQQLADWPEQQTVLRMTDLERGPLLMALQSRRSDLKAYFDDPGMGEYYGPSSDAYKCLGYESMQVESLIELIEAIGWDHPDLAASEGRGVEVISASISDGINSNANNK